MNRILVLFLAISTLGCAARDGKLELPDDVLVADKAIAVNVRAADVEKGLEVPPIFKALPEDELRDLAIYRIGENLQPLPHTIKGGRIQAGFARGERVLIHSPLNRFTVDKYTLLCRFQAVNVSLRSTFLDLQNRICPVILCPAELFRADRLLDRFPQLEGFPDQFGRDEMSQMELRPIQGDFEITNICDQCLGRGFGDVLIPECEELTPRRVCWTALGPGPTTQGQVENITNREVVGAINAVSLHPTDPDVAFVGGANGGIWRTDNLTATNPHWTPQTDFKESLSIGALEFDPTQLTNPTLWAGFARTSSLLRRGGPRAGLLRTTNGTTWTTIAGTIAGLNVTGIAPRGDTVVVTANTADTFANRGIWRSTDTGGMWTQVSGAPGTGLPTGASFDLVGDPNDTSRLYAHAGTRIFRSDDIGAIWTPVSNAAVDTALTSATNVELAIGTSDNLYVAIVTGGRLSNLFRMDSTGSWTAIDLPQTTENAGSVFGIHPGGQGGLHLSLAADPTDENIVYIGGDRQPCSTEAAGCQLPGVPRFPNSIGARNFTGRLFRIDASQPTGSQATPITHVNTASNSAPHADSRDMDVDANGNLIETDDGGIYRRTNPLTNTGDWFSLNGNIQTTELHATAWDTNANIAIGGAQDTGTPEEIATGGVTWRSVLTADGGDVAVDDTGTPGISDRYASTQFLGNFRRRRYDSANTLQSTVALTPIQVTAGSNPVVAQFYTPIKVNNQNPSQLVMGANNSVYESIDQGANWNEIAVGVRVNDLGSDPIAYGATGNASMLYVGSGAQVLIRTTAAGALTASATYPGAQQVLDLAIDTGDPNTAFAIDAGNVFMTDDAGTGWTDITGNLGTLRTGTLRSLAFAPGATERIAVGTDNGVFYADGVEFNEWRRLGCNLPTAPVYDLDYDDDDRLWLAGTLGRGAWTLPR